MDVNYFERLSGLAADNDKWYVDSYSQTYTQPRAVQPILQRLSGDYAVAIPAFINNGWMNEPGYVPYFPVHFSDPFVENTYQLWVDTLHNRHCIFSADLNCDFYVNHKDLALLNSMWMECTDPGNSACSE